MRLGVCLSLTGRFAPFGRQAAQALELWAGMSGHDVEIADDESDAETFKARFDALRVDLYLGPYGTGLTRVAAEAFDRLLFNHGGAGDDVQSLRPGRVVSILAPASRYADPFLEQRDAGVPLVVRAGPGRFGRQVAAGVRGAAPDGDYDDWDLFSCGRFEDDVAIVRAAQRAPRPPRTICSIAAGVRAFKDHVEDTRGIYGIAQWVPGAAVAEIGPPQDAFVAFDYPAIQAVAGAVIATHCARLADDVEPDALFAAAASLETTTLLGAFGIDPVTGAQTRHTPVLVTN